MAFPFLKLPTEIRHKIYGYLVISPSPDPWVRPKSQTMFYSYRLSLNILDVNRQIDAEASQILYEQNTGAIRDYDFGGTCTLFRVDNYINQRTLRSRRSVTKSGLIYPHIFDRFSNIRIELENSERLSPFVKTFGSHFLREALAVLSKPPGSQIEQDCRAQPKMLRLKLVRLDISHKSSGFLAWNLSRETEQVLFAKLVRDGLMDLMKQVHKTRKVIIEPTLSPTSQQRFNELLTQEGDDTVLY